MKDRHTDAQYYCEEAILLHRTIQAFYEGISYELGNSVNTTAHICLLTAVAICYSAQITLYDMYTCTEEDRTNSAGTPLQLELQSIALTGIFNVCNEVHSLSKRLSAIIDSDGLNCISPFLCECLYTAGINAIWLIQESGRKDIFEFVADIKNLLASLGQRWNVASTYTCVFSSYTCIDECSDEYLKVLNDEENE